MRKFIKSLRDDPTAATAIEYGLILAMVFLAMIVSVQGVGNETINLWNTVTEHVDTSSNPSV